METLKAEIDELRKEVTDPQHTSSLDLCEECLDEKIHHESIKRIIESIRILIRQQEK